MEDEKYIKGFNDGYILSKYKSPLATSISKTVEKRSDYDEGLIEGIETLEKELIDKNVQGFKDLRGKDNLNIER